MKISAIFEIGRCGVGVNRKVFDYQPIKWSVRIAVGIAAVTIVWGDAAAIRGFGAAQDGDLGVALRTLVALRALEEAVRADKIGCLSVASKYDSKGNWMRDEFQTTNAALDRLDAIRMLGQKGKGE